MSYISLLSHFDVLLREIEEEVKTQLEVSNQAFTKKEEASKKSHVESQNYERLLNKRNELRTLINKIRRGEFKEPKEEE